MKDDYRRAITISSIGLLAIVFGVTAAATLTVYRAGMPSEAGPALVHLLPGERLPVFSPRAVARLSASGSWSYFLWSFAPATVLSALAMGALAWLLFPKKREQTGDHGSAHWANKEEIRDTGLLSARGIVVGALKKRKKVQLLRYDGEGHVFVVSPSRSGKGVTVVVPTALTWEHSILFNDIKGELWTLTAGWRKKHFNSICLRFDATCEDGSAARWNPLFEIRPYPYDVRDAQNIALTLTTSDSSSSRTDNERYWSTMGTRLIKASILHQLYAGKEKTLPGCYRLLTSTSRDLEDTLLLMLRTKHDRNLKYGWKDVETGRPVMTHPAIAHVARDMLSKSNRERSAIVGSAVSYLEPFDDPIMAANVSESDFSLSDLMHHDQPVSLYLTASVADLQRVQSLHRLFFTLAGTRNMEHLVFKDGQLAPKYKHRLLEVFDECAHLGYSPVIEKQFSLASGYGIQGMFVFQDFSQLFALYGRNESITSNCDVKVTFAPNSLATADYLSRLLGVETREKGGDGAFLGTKKPKASYSFGRPLLTSDECSRLPRDKGIILRNGFPPILADKVSYLKIPALFNRTKIKPPPSDRIALSTPRWWEEQVERRRSSPPISAEKKSTGRQLQKRQVKAKATSTKGVNGDQIGLFDFDKTRNE